MKKIIILALATVISVASTIGLLKYQSNYCKDKYQLECKILDTYQTGAGYRAHPIWGAVIYVYQYGITTDVRLDPSGEYKARMAKQEQKNILYMFSQQEVDKLNGDYNEINTGLRLLATIVLCLFSFILLCWTIVEILYYFTEEE